MRFANNNILLLIISTLNAFAGAVGETDNEICQTPTGGIGTCILIQSCTALYNMALNPNIKNEERQYLKSSQCGWANRKPLVCCPASPPIPSRSLGIVECETPNKMKGNCVPIKECNTLLPLLYSSPRSMEGNFLLSSRCGSGWPQVCCPDPSANDRAQLPQPPNCGYVPSTNRIFGGTVADIDEFPWTALIIYAKSNNQDGYHCGGTLINDRYVLTAAHCVSKRILPSDWRLTGVRLGEWNQDTPIDCQIDSKGISICASPHVDINVEEQICHPLYNVRSQKNDIALLRLQQKVNYNDFIKPICLPAKANFRLDNLEGASMDISGWGATENSNSSNTKLKAAVKGRNLEQCNRKYLSFGIELNENQMCAGGERLVDTCNGDSGGPLMYAQEFNGMESYYLVGVVSFGPRPCGQEGIPGVYTSVSAYIDWIQNTIRK